jgi:hypothetical protein
MLLLRSGLGMVIFGLAFVANAVTAQEAIPARVTAVDKENQSLTVSLLKAPEGMPREVRLSVEPRAEIKGIRSLEELESGDEIKFEGTKKSDAEWSISKLETEAPEAAAGERSQVQEPSQAAHFFENVKQQIRGAWYSLRYSIPENQEIYEAYGAKRVQRLETRFFNLKGKVSQKESVESKIRQAGERLGFLKAAESKEVWKDAKTDFESSVTQANAALREAASQILPDKVLYEWDAEERIERLRYDLNLLHATYQTVPSTDKNRPEGESTEQGRAIQELHQEVDAAEARLGEIKDSRLGTWEAKRKELDQQLFQIQDNYYNVFAKIGPTLD